MAKYAVQKTEAEESFDILRWLDRTPNNPLRALRALMSGSRTFSVLTCEMQV